MWGQLTETIPLSALLHFTTVHGRQLGHVWNLDTELQSKIGWITNASRMVTCRWASSCTICKTSVSCVLYSVKHRIQPEIGQLDWTSQSFDVGVESTYMLNHPIKDMKLTTLNTLTIKTVDNHRHQVNQIIVLNGCCSSLKHTNISEWHWTTTAVQVPVIRNVYDCWLMEEAGMDVKVGWIGREGNMGRQGKNFTLPQPPVTTGMR